MLKKRNKKSSFPHDFRLQIRLQRGFTLIEMLIVIAIIGILAGIVLVALGGARAKAKDARIIQEMSQIRNAAGIYYNSTDYSFTGFSCSTPDPNMLILCADINDQTQGSDIIIVALDQNYCAEVQLNSGAWWCVDAKGRSARYDSTTTPTEPACDDTSGSEVYTCEP